MVYTSNSSDLCQIDFAKLAQKYLIQKTSDKVGVVGSPFDKNGILQVTHVHWDINHWMKKEPLDTHAIDVQFELIATTMSELYATCHLIDYPDHDDAIHDIIFAANHFSAIRPLPSSQYSEPVVFLSHMAHTQRQSETPYVIGYLRALGQSPILMPDNCNFEGAGDLIQTPFINIGFVGDRTHKEAYRFTQDYASTRGITLPPILLIKTPKNSIFYHGDLKFKPLDHIDPSTGKLSALILKSAFDSTDYHALAHIFQLIDVDETEAVEQLAVNCITGYSAHHQTNVALITDHTPKLKKTLESVGYHVLTVPLATKSLGGGPWCMVNEI